MKLGPTVPDKWRLTLSRRSSRNLKPHEDSEYLLGLILTLNAMPMTGLRLFFFFWLTYCQHMYWNANIFIFFILWFAFHIFASNTLSAPPPVLCHVPLPSSCFYPLSYVSLVSFLSLTVLQSIYNCYVLLYRTHWGRVRKLCSSEKCVMSFYFQHDTQTEVQTNLLSAKTVNLLGP